MMLPIKMTPDEVRQIINDELSWLIKTDRLVIPKHLQVLDARNIQLGNKTGTKIGTESSQKIGFYGVDPVAQQNAVGVPSGGGDAGVDSSARTAITTIIAILKNIGITK